MKISKKIFAAVLAMVMLFTLCSCGKDKGSEGNNGMANYQVKVLDGQGKPMTSGVIVKFLQNGEQVAMQPVNGEGIAAKELAKGDYTVELTFTSSDMSGHYDTTATTLSADKTYLELRLINKVGNATYDLVAGGADHRAYIVSAGSTYVPVKASVRNYYVFSPTESGTYEISVDNNDVTVGYYGAPHFVQSASALDVVDNKITLSISESSLGGSYVFGLDGLDADTEVVLGVIRTGDPTITISDMPWTEYKTTHTPTPYTLNLGGKNLKYVDIKGKTEDAKIVFNDADGFYHFGSADGPVVLMHLGKKAPYVSLQTVIEGDGLGGGAPIRKYFFDSQGEFLKKEDYTDILRTYFANMDSNAGVYPLTKDLEYIIKNGCSGWWTKDDPNFIFTDCNPEIGWMFALCYVA